MDMRVAPSPPAVTRMSLRQHIRRTLALAVPVMLARAGLIIMMTVGTVMVGQAGPHELAWFAISLAPQNMMLVIGIGLLIGGAVLTAQADGARRSEQCGRIWKQTMIVASCVGLVYVVALQWSEAILLGLGQTAAIAAGIARWLMVAAIVGYILNMKDGAHYGVRLPLPGHHGAIVKQLRLGL